MLSLPIHIPNQRTTREEGEGVALSKVRLVSIHLAFSNHSSFAKSIIKNIIDYGAKVFKIEHDKHH